MGRLRALLILVAVLGCRRSATPPFSTWQEPITRMEFVYLPPGQFEMGSPISEPGHREDEHQHQVTLSHGFWMGRTEVTQAQWQRVMGEVEPHPEKPSPFRHGDGRYPVVSVSYMDVMQFLQRLNSLEPESHFRLPTEAEWEYACRAGTDTPFNTGHSLTPEQAALNARPLDSSLGHPSPVGNFPPNAWGLCDTHGNAWEWTSDWYGPYPSHPVKDPQGPAEGTLKVIRGGSWAFDAENARSATRYTHAPKDWGYSLGFRIVREQSQP